MRRCCGPWPKTSRTNGGAPSAKTASPRLHERTQHRVDARLVAFAARLEPIDNVGVEPDVNVLLRRGNAEHDFLFPTLRRLAFFFVGEAFDLGLFHRLNALPVGAAFATRDAPRDTWCCIAPCATASILCASCMAPGTCPTWFRAPPQAGGGIFVYRSAIRV